MVDPTTILMLTTNIVFFVARFCIYSILYVKFVLHAIILWAYIKAVCQPLSFQKTITASQTAILGAVATSCDLVG
jgi:hypothetical protein